MRRDPAPAWLRSSGQPTAGSVGASLLPTAVFLVTHWTLGTAPAAVAAGASALALILWRRSRGAPAGWLLPLSLGYVLIRALAGAVTASEDVYFAFGIAASVALALAVLASAATRAPAAVFLMPLVARYDDVVVRHPIYRRVAAQLTVVWALAEVSVSGWEAWHLTRASAAEFIVLRTFVGWPLVAFVVFWLIFYMRFRLDRLAAELGAARPRHAWSRRGP